ncbi:hypothetical protein QBC47DRAFT_183835 [Echria macrotheca]|uniref:Erythromycin esterase n=1 Tax=Echria macrotheca TaxID=438768 RepID=A0AAJ0BE97_9PEZI|nr:hypothetical protein QBC47DRAFT_183835 [Echria macrotheca]
MARRSARLASATKAPTPAIDAPNLDSIAERDNSPPEGAPQSLNAVVSSPSIPKTPRDSSPPKPPMSEMHPTIAHRTTAAPSSALRLGFTDIKPRSGSKDKLPEALQETPSKIHNVPTSDFTFSFRRVNADLKLGPEAQRMMEELREQAALIKAELAARPEEQEQNEAVNNRKIARAKGKSGRFSAAHMAAFKKMDSIANHPSAYRAQLAKTTPLKAGIKRSQSKADLDEPDSVRSRQPASAFKAIVPASTEAPSRVKRVRQHIDDDASSSRPVSRDGSSLPRPKSALRQPKPNLASLMTPTKSSLARTTSVRTPAHGSLARSPSKSTLSGIPRSTTMTSLPTVENKPEKESEPFVEAKSPSRFEKVRSIFQKSKVSQAKARSAIPTPSMFGSKTPGAPRVQQAPVSVQAPMTTPRKLIKRVAFSPETQLSPSPVKSGIPRSKVRQPLGEVYYPTLDTVMTQDGNDDAVSYPDLSAHRPLPEPPVKEVAKPAAEPSSASTFTFRSDHTISFGGGSTSFGSSPGQASVRSVRPSILPTENMPGSFPSSVMVSSPKKENKENVAPRTVFLALPHGMQNKKRNRPNTDEEDAELEAAERAAKKRRQEEVPEGDAIFAPRLIASAKKPGSSVKKPLSAASTASTASPTKRGISLSRLHMLSRPKMRK